VAAGEDAREVSLGQLAAFAESEGAVATLGRTKRVRRSGEDRCRLCAAPLAATFADLGKSPIANSYPTAEELDAMEPFYPLRARVCGECLLVQVGEFESPSQIFSDYAYFSSYSTSWLEHSGRLAESLAERLELSRDHLVVELASNDGYLLRHFADRGVPVLGIEPAANVAEVAQSRGIPTQVAFFGAEVARGLAGRARADVVLGLNVLAHVPDLNDFVAGVKLLLAETGVAVFEFPHLMRLIKGLQFDTIYHEHFSYLSLLTARRAFARHELELVDVEELPTHGGSLRVHVRHSGSGAVPSPRVEELARREQASGLTRLETYEAFDEAVRREKREIVAFLTGLRREGRRIAGYGAPAKGNTLINYCGIGRETLEYTVDANPAKQGRYLPGSEIPIRPPEELRETRPDVVLILPWNLREEIVAQHGYVREWGGRFAARTPSIALLP
jgi:SAM-dependent methyltransferase